MNLNSTELTKELSRRSEVKLDSVKLILSSLGAVVQSALTAGGEVALPGIGKITSSQRKARIGTNPANGQPLEIKAKRVAKIKPSVELRSALAS